MANNGKHEHLSTDDAHHLRQYLVRATKAYLCVLCWFGIVALLLMDGPAPLSVPSGPTHASGVVAVVTGVMLSGGLATILTIGLAVGVVAGIARIRRSGEQNEPDATDGMEDETRA